MKTDWVKIMWMAIVSLFLACIILVFVEGYPFW